ncbi:hypothetical protein D3C83_15960 [compost metagenome]
MARSNGWFASSGASYTVLTCMIGIAMDRASAISRLVDSITRWQSGSGTGSEAMAGSRLPRWQSMVTTTVVAGSRCRASFMRWIVRVRSMD